MDLGAILVSAGVHVLLLIVSTLAIYFLLKKANVTFGTALLTSLVSVIFGIILGGVLSFGGSFLSILGTYAGLYGGFYLMLNVWKKVDQEVLKKVSWIWLIIMVVANIIISLLAVGVLAYFGFLSP